MATPAGRGVDRHPADHAPAVPLEQPPGGDDAAGVVPADRVHRDGVDVVLLELRRYALLLHEDAGAQRRHLRHVRRLRDGGAHRTPAEGSARLGTARKRRSISACSSTGSSSEPVSRYSAAITAPRTAVVSTPPTPW